MRLAAFLAVTLFLCKPLGAQVGAPRDTAALIAALEATLKTNPKRADAATELGIILAHRASYNPTQHQQRARAEELLDQALKADPANPRIFAALGELYDKMWLAESRDRTVARAVETAQAHPDRIGGYELAHVYYLLAVAAVSSYEAVLGLKIQGEGLTGHADDCPGSFCVNWLRPKVFNEQLRLLPEANLAGPLRARGDSLLALALQTDPTHAGARRLRMRVMARDSDWAGFTEHAEQYARFAHDPFAPLYVALAHYKLAQSDADSLFRSAIAQRPDSARAAFEDLRPFLNGAEEKTFAALDARGAAAFRRAFWRAREPLFLTPENEWELEYYARAALAELIAGDPARGWRGTATDVGQIVMRFGLPERSWQFGGAEEDARTVFWNYGDEYANFIFVKERGPVRARIIGKPPEAASVIHDDHLPPPFRPPYEFVAGINAQFVRRRGEHGTDTDVLVVGRTPVELRGGYANAGFFVMRASPGLPSVGEGRQLTDKDGNFNFRMTLDPGTYSYSLEALTVDRLRASVLRSDLNVNTWAPFAVSDLLLSTRMKAARDDAAALDDFEFEPLRCMSVPENRRVGLAFEVYGLTPEANGDAKYRVSISLSGISNNSLPSRVLRGLGISTRTPAMVTSFDRQRRVKEDRVVEWFELELPPNLSTGANINVAIHDATSNRDVTTSRQLSLRACK